jgi:hypothetical protein
MLRLTDRLKNPVFGGDEKTKRNKGTTWKRTKTKTKTIRNEDRRGL